MRRRVGAEHTEEVLAGKGGVMLCLRSWEAKGDVPVVSAGRGSVSAEMGEGRGGTHRQLELIMLCPSRTAIPCDSPRSAVCPIRYPRQLIHSRAVSGLARIVRRPSRMAQA